MARDGQSLEGRWPATSLQRLVEGAPAEAPAVGWPEVQWAARAELRERRAAEPELWLHLNVQAQVSQSCQRCLQPVQLPLHVDRWFRFVRDEELAASLDAESDDDVLALGGRLDLLELVEDELLLELPLVPRHEECPQPLPMATAGDDAEDALPAEERPHPFAALAALKKTKQ